MYPVVDVRARQHDGRFEFDVLLQPEADLSAVELVVLTPEAFLRMAATTMRNTLLDHLRARGRQKRGGQRTRLKLDALALAATGSFDDILDIDQAIERLQDQDREAAEVVRLRFYSGLRMDEIAASLGRSERSVERAWAYARAWLYRELTDRG